MNSKLFKIYVEKVLCPTLNVGDIVIMDNLSSHKVTGIKKMIESVGAKLKYLPPYSPDFNPIELLWDIAVLLNINKVTTMIKSASTI